MSKNDLETFRGKLYLLVIDKVVIGALIAIALFAYDRWKTQEIRRYNEETQLTFRRAEYIKQLVPIVLNDKKNKEYRAHSLGALVATKSIDENSAVNFAQKLLDSDLLKAQAIPWQPNNDKKTRETIWRHFCDKTDGGLYIPMPSGWRGDSYELEGQSVVRALLEMDAFSTPLIERSIVNKIHSGMAKKPPKGP